MARKWSIKTYNNAIREIRKEHPNLSLARARATWTSLSERLGKPASSVAVRNNSRDVSLAMRSSAGKARLAEREESGAAAGPTPIRSIEQWEDFYDDAYDYDPPEEINAGVDTGKGKGK